MCERCVSQQKKSKESRLDFRGARLKIFNKDRLTHTHTYALKEPTRMHIGHFLLVMCTLLAATVVASIFTYHIVPAFEAPLPSASPNSADDPPNDEPDSPPPLHPPTDTSTVCEGGSVELTIAWCS